MAKSNNAADPYEEALEEAETPDLFYDPKAQPIVKADTDTAEEAEPEPADEEAKAARKDSPEEEPVALDEEESASDEEPEEEAPADPQTADADDEVPESEKKRFQYWQSEADKAKAELRKLKNQYGDLPPQVISLAQNINQRPDLLDAVEAAMQGKFKPGQTPSQTGEQVKLEPPERPQKPQKPDGYDHFEALNNPESESYKYLAAKERYEDDLQDWLLKREEYRERLEERSKRQQERQQQQQQQMQQVVNNLRDGYGMKDSEIKEFFDVVNKEPDLDDLVKYYRVKTGKTPEPADSHRVEELKRRRAKSKSSPPPAGTGGSAAKKAATPAEPEGPFTWAS